MRLMWKFQVIDVNICKVCLPLEGTMLLFSEICFKAFRPTQCSIPNPLQQPPPAWGPKMAFLLVAKTAEVYRATWEPEEKPGSTPGCAPA